MFIEYIIGDTGFGDTVTSGKRCKRIPVLESIPESANVGAVEIGKFAIIAVKKGTGQTACWNKHSASFDDWGRQEFVPIVCKDSRFVNLVTFCDVFECFPC